VTSFLCAHLRRFVVTKTLFIERDARQFSSMQQFFSNVTCDEDDELSWPEPKRSEKNLVWKMDLQSRLLPPSFWVIIVQVSLAYIAYFNLQMPKFTRKLSFFWYPACCLLLFEIFKFNVWWVWPARTMIRFYLN